LLFACQLDTSLTTYIARSYAALEELDFNSADHHLLNAVHTSIAKWWTLPDVNGWPQQPLMQVGGVGGRDCRARWSATRCAQSQGPCGGLHRDACTRFSTFLQLLLWLVLVHAPDRRPPPPSVA
jgi:hypothetical protein